MINYSILPIKNKQMKNLTKLAVLFLVLIIFSCEKEDDKTENTNQSVIIQTDKENYSVGETVFIEIMNHYDKNVEYYICSSYTGIPPIIYKYVDNEWTGYWAPICDGFISRCCGELEANDMHEDAFNFDFEKGKYKVEYMFVIEHGQGYQTFYSNEFIFE